MVTVALLPGTVRASPGRDAVAAAVTAAAASDFLPPPAITGLGYVILATAVDRASLRACNRDDAEAAVLLTVLPKADRGRARSTIGGACPGACVTGRVWVVVAAVPETIAVPDAEAEAEAEAETGRLTGGMIAIGAAEAAGPVTPLP